MKPNPCYKCEERTQYCHSKCEKYSAWNEEHRAFKAEVNKRKAYEAVACDADIKRWYKIKKGKNIR